MTDDRYRQEMEDSRRAEARERAEKIEDQSERINALRKAGRAAFVERAKETGILGPILARQGPLAMAIEQDSAPPGRRQKHQGEPI